MDKKKRKPEVGETLYASYRGYYSKNSSQLNLIPVIVTKVGKKYFYCSENGTRPVKYNINTWTEESAFAQTIALYENPKEWDDQKEWDRIKSKISYTFGTYRNCEEVSLESLKKIEEIIDSEQESKQ